jgi:hypothetical protein
MCERLEIVRTTEDSHSTRRNFDRVIEILTFRTPQVVVRLNIDNLMFTIYGHEDGMFKEIHCYRDISIEDGVITIKFHREDLTAEEVAEELSKKLVFNLDKIRNATGEYVELDFPILPGKRAQ